MWDGGLPQNPRPPFNYLLTFNIAGLTNEYAEPPVFLRDGKLTEVPPMTELESRLSGAGRPPGGVRHRRRRLDDALDLRGQDQDLPEQDGPLPRPLCPAACLLRPGAVAHRPGAGRAARWCRAICSMPSLSRWSPSPATRTWWSSASGPPGARMAGRRGDPRADRLLRRGDRLHGHGADHRLGRGHRGRHDGPRPDTARGDSRSSWRCRPTCLWRSWPSAASRSKPALRRCKQEPGLLKRPGSFT